MLAAMSNRAGQDAYGISCMQTEENVSAERGPKNHNEGFYQMKRSSQTCADYL